MLVLVAACAVDDIGSAPEGEVGAGGKADENNEAGMPTAAQLLAALPDCNSIGGDFASDVGTAANIDVCGGANLAFWRADLDIDCDGKESDACNWDTDPWFMNQTAATDSNGEPLDSAVVPFVVFPGASWRWDFRNHDLQMGSVFAVIHGDKVVYGVAGDIGPTAVIGEASYRMAELLGIDPDPHTGGTDAGVTYIAFTGAAARVSVIEDHDEAVRIGVALSRTLIQEP